MAAATALVPCPAVPCLTVFITLKKRRRMNRYSLLRAIRIRIFFFKVLSSFLVGLIGQIFKWAWKSFLACTQRTTTTTATATFPLSSIVCTSPMISCALLHHRSSFARCSSSSSSGCGGITNRLYEIIHIIAWAKAAHGSHQQQHQLRRVWLLRWWRTR